MTDNESKFLSGVRTLAIPRLEDLPYYSSPPIQFVYESTAQLLQGAYVWNDAPTALTPNRPINSNYLYYFRSLSMSADISELDYTANIITTPQFFTFLQSDALAVMFREPILMVKFFDQFDYRYTWSTQSGQDQLFGAFRGSLIQGANLIGKNTITLTAVISAQEIVDEEYIQLFKKSYPGSSKGTP